MKSMRKNIPPWVPVSLLILVGLVCLILLWNAASTTSLGDEDFIAYWSATHLLSNGLNPYDPELIRNLENAQTGRGLVNALMAWNPPFLFVFLLPLAWLPFSIAKFVWLIANILIVVSGSVMLTRLYLPPGNNLIIIIYLLFAFSLPQIVTGIVMGQVTYLVFLGLVACMALIKKEQWFWAGAVLILTTVKPHVVVLPVIYLLIYMAVHRQYRGWIGLMVAGLACLGVAFLFRPQLANDLMGEMAIAPVHWFTPTIGGLLSYWGISEATRYMITLLLPLPFILVKYQAQVKMELAVALLTLITVPTTFFGWSFDQTVLLVPIAQVFSWMALSKHKTINTLGAITIAASLVAIYLQRISNSGDVYYLWVPLFWWLIFGLNWYLFSTTDTKKS
jgi:hypothetical protein